MTRIELRPLSPKDGPLVYRLLQRVPAHENGFYNGANGLSYEEYKKWLLRRNEIQHGINLEEGAVAESTYWLIVNDIPVGIGKIRHKLTPALKKHGGSISYSIAPQYRNNGYGTVLLSLLLEQAKSMEVPELLVMIYNYNYPSEKVIIKNGGIFCGKTELRTYYQWDT